LYFAYLILSFLKGHLFSSRPKSAVEEEEEPAAAAGKKGGKKRQGMSKNKTR